MGVYSLISVCILTILGYGLFRGYEQRSMINRLRKQGVVMPPDWSWIFGHLLAFGRYAAQLPNDANVLSGNAQIGRDMGKETYVLDLWPMAKPMLFTGDINLATAIVSTHNLPKEGFVQDGMRRITGGPDILSINGHDWKFWRSMFNPGFSMSNINNQVGPIVDSVETFSDILRDHASGDIFNLVPMTTRLTMEVMIKISMDLDLQYQRAETPLAHALRMVVGWNSFWDPRVLFNPLRPVVQRYYGNIMNRIIGKRLQELFDQLKSTRNANVGQAKSVATLALEAYIAETKDDQILENVQLDKRFADHTTYQIRLFLFAGNDTTSSTICYVYHCLSKHPEVLARVRQEHNAELSSDPSRAASLIREQPLIINKLEYTLAVIKETLRLFPPAGTTRSGAKSVVLKDADGNYFPTADLSITVVHELVQKSTRFWQRPDEFLPERWMVEPGHELYVQNKEAFRPFEIGPRACIAQNLVYSEIRIVLAMTIRTFDILPAYDEWDARNRAREGVAKKVLRALGLTNDIKTVYGNRAYQTDDAGSHPANGYPCRVKLL